MTEIRVDVDLEQPPSVVWRAFTEAHLVTDWLPTTRFLVRDDGTFTFQAHDLEGLEDPIEGQLVTVEAERRMVMRWEAVNLHTVVAITLTERGAGSRFTLTQSGFLGPQGTMRRRVLLATYTTLFEGPLSATLAKIAAQDAAVSEAPAPTTVKRNDGGPFNRLPRQPSVPSRSAPGLSSSIRSTAGPRPTTPVPGFAAAVLGAHATGVAEVAPAAVPAQPDAPAVDQAEPDAPVASRPAAVRTARLGALTAPVRDGWRWLAGARDWSADRRSQAMAAGAAVLLLLAMAAILVGKSTALHPADPPQTGGESPGPAQASVPAASGRPTATVPPPVVPATTRSPASAPPASVSASQPGTAGFAQLIAVYKTEDLSLTAYRVTVTISNPTETVANDWAVVIVLPLLDFDVSNVSGARQSRSGLRVSFTPLDSNRKVAPGATVTIRFDVNGLGVRNGPFTCTIDGRPCTAAPA
ncbi:SRPBCC domain-containing protein [Dactylosporangium sp. CA-139066]|uniref:SRPBCC domain-containing protein n=1 Tax=Dactylosporangium sp. CA-139066 TaxID=3239930 RepID=UPI003D8CA17C